MCAAVCVHWIFIGFCGTDWRRRRWWKNIKNRWQYSIPFGYNSIYIYLLTSPIFNLFLENVSKAFVACCVCLSLLVVFSFFFCLFVLLFGLGTKPINIIIISNDMCISFDVNRNGRASRHCLWALSSDFIRNSIGHAMTMFSNSSSTTLKRLNIWGLCRALAA